MLLNALFLFTFLSLPTSIEAPPKLNEPLVVEVNEFDPESSKEFEKQMELAESTGQKIIPVVIDSYGGSVRALMRMVDVILAAKVPVATICIGKCMSAAAVLLAMGTEGMRYATPNSTILFHEISGGVEGKLSDVKISVEEADRLNTELFHLVAKNTGHEKNYFLNRVKSRHTDWYLTPEETLKLNVINHISLPSLKIKLKATYVLE